jgi:hypothetical protein
MTKNGVYPSSSFKQVRTVQEKEPGDNRRLPQAPMRDTMIVIGSPLDPLPFPSSYRYVGVQRKPMTFIGIGMRVKSFLKFRAFNLSQIPVK